ncbi:MAG: hypothetical protein A3D87_00200 [Omnitrophica WOR_2 bacterium RIFCSPHIGHO2_02_FULL_50_17]|nr:MAG: hypothetical protein A3D87_00200 [Omnitrophica WOR_2 bacterium RIFCSPHIGHO2_02_FULL_50_17]
MKKFKSIATVGLPFWGILFLASCSDVTPVDTTLLSEAHGKFLQICREEYNLNVLIRPLKATVWVYVPLRENLLQIAAGKEGAQKSSTPQERPAVKFLEASFALTERLFLIRYDIGRQKVYPQSPGYGVEYTQAYRQTSRQILSAVSRSYFSSAKTEGPPQFFVVVLTDIQNGIEIENTFYLDDLKKYMTLEAIPQEEYTKRSLYELKGNLDFIGDTEGRHLDYKEIALPDFLARQIANRINFQYQRSAFPPSDDARAEILNIAAATLRYYQFSDFTAVALRNLADGSAETIPAANLANYTEEETEQKGRLIHIQFR